MNRGGYLMKISEQHNILSDLHQIQTHNEVIMLPTPALPTRGNLVPSDPTFGSSRNAAPLKCTSARLLAWNAHSFAHPSAQTDYPSVYPNINSTPLSVNPF